LILPVPSEPGERGELGDFGDVTGSQSRETSDWIVWRYEREEAINPKEKDGREERKAEGGREGEGRGRYGREEGRRRL